MHTKGEAAKKLKEQLQLDTCIYLGNDLNDISMFSNALDDNDFIVIASNEHPNITNTLVDYLKEECKVKGIEWEDAKLLVLEDQNVNKFLHRIRTILTLVNSKRKQQDLKKKYRVNINNNVAQANAKKQPKKKKKKTYR